MKRTVLLLVLTMGIFTLTNAQEVGIRIGSGAAAHANGALDVVFSTSQFSRLHGDVSFGYGIGIDLLWDFLYRPLGGEAFNWYVGAGPYTLIHPDHFHLGAVGEIGLEYRFNSVPIALGLDWRPYFRIIDDTGFSFAGGGLNIRYVFGKK